MSILRKIAAFIFAISGLFCIACMWHYGIHFFAQSDNERYCNFAVMAGCAIAFILLTIDDNKSSTPHWYDNVHVMD